MFYRALPYDPVRPWKEGGYWYHIPPCRQTGATTKKLPCSAGGQLDLYRSKQLRFGWEHIGALFTTNTTINGSIASENILAEFVTSNYIGGIPGDPNGGLTRVVTQNRGQRFGWGSNTMVYLPKTYLGQ